MKKLVEFGSFDEFNEDEYGPCDEELSLSNIHVQLNMLIRSETERMERTGFITDGKSRLAKRLKLAEQAGQLMQQARQV